MLITTQLAMLVEEFLSKLSKTARVKVKTTLNPMGFDIDNVSKFNLDEDFIKKQQSIRSSYERMGVTLSFSCIPYEIFDLPEKNTQVSFAETNPTIYVNSIAHLKTNKESAFASAFGVIYLENNFFTTFVVFSSLVLPERIVPIKILNGPSVSAS